MKNIKNYKENTCDLPDVLDFLNSSRTIIRQINIFKEIKMSKEHKVLTINAAVKVAEEALKYAEENADDSV